MASPLGPRRLPELVGQELQLGPAWRLWPWASPEGPLHAGRCWTLLLGPLPTGPSCVMPTGDRLEHSTESRSYWAGSQARLWAASALTAPEEVGVATRVRLSGQAAGDLRGPAGMSEFGSSLHGLGPLAPQSCVLWGQHGPGRANELTAKPSGSPFP